MLSFQHVVNLKIIEIFYIIFHQVFKIQYSFFFPPQHRPLGSGHRTGQQSVGASLTKSLT